MSDPLIMQFAALAVTVVVGVCVVYAIVQMRRSYLDQQQKMFRAIAVSEEFPKLQREFLLFLRRIEADSHELQRIVLQIEGAVAAIHHGISSVMTGSTERQIATIESFRDYMDAQEQRLAAIGETISDGFRAISRARETVSDERQENGSQYRLRKDVLSRDPELRFTVLKEWLSINALAIRHRASRNWKTASDLITNVPAYLEPEAEILGDCILLIGTREHLEKLAMPVRELESSSDYQQWFETPLKGHAVPYAPAVLMPSNGRFSLLAKGTSSPGITH